MQPLENMATKMGAGRARERRIDVTVSEMDQRTEEISPCRCVVRVDRTSLEKGDREATRGAGGPGQVIAPAEN